MAQGTLKFSIASDHAGYRYKEKIKQHLQSLGHVVKDFGTGTPEPIDYPITVRPAAEAVANNECDLGIVLGGSGNGEAMVANKVKGIRCAVVWNNDSARLSKEHNNANVISIGERMIDENKVLEVVDTWLSAKFEGGRHLRRINAIEK